MIGELIAEAKRVLNVEIKETMEVREALEGCLTKAAHYAIRRHLGVKGEVSSALLNRRCWEVVRYPCPAERQHRRAMRDEARRIQLFGDEVLAEEEIEPFLRAERDRITAAIDKVNGGLRSLSDLIVGEYGSTPADQLEGLAARLRRIEPLLEIPARGFHLGGELYSTSATDGQVVVKRWVQAVPASSSHGEGLVRGWTPVEGEERLLVLEHIAMLDVKRARFEAS